VPQSLDFVVFMSGIFAIPAIVGVLFFLIHMKHKADRMKMEMLLKHQMIERGMSPSDIERVLRATGDMDVRRLEALCEPEGSQTVQEKAS
jgi:hypothetical protein